MIINNFNVEEIFPFNGKAYTELVIDSNAVLSLTVTMKQL